MVLETVPFKSMQTKYNRLHNRKSTAKKGFTLPSNSLGTKRLLINAFKKTTPLLKQATSAVLKTIGVTVNNLTKRALSIGSKMITKGMQDHEVYRRLAIMEMKIKQIQVERSKNQRKSLVKKQHLESILNAHRVSVRNRKTGSSQTTQQQNSRVSLTRQTKRGSEQVSVPNCTKRNIHSSALLQARKRLNRVQKETPSRTTRSQTKFSLGQFACLSHPTTSAFLQQALQRRRQLCRATSPAENSPMSDW